MEVQADNWSRETERLDQGFSSQNFSTSPAEWGDKLPQLPQPSSQRGGMTERFNKFFHSSFEEGREQVKFCLLVKY